VESLLHAAAQGSGLQQQRGAYLRAVPDRRPRFKRDFKTVGDSLPKVLQFVLSHTGLKAGLAERFRSVMTIMRNGEQIATELIATRCQRGAEIARLLRFPETVSQGIYSLDEHFNGQGRPAGLAGESIPLYARIALLAQVIDVFHTAGGAQAALDEIQLRAGRWFDPQLVKAFGKVADSADFWATLGDARDYRCRPGSGTGRERGGAGRRLS
jgi:hypothetical protein